MPGRNPILTEQLEQSSSHRTRAEIEARQDNTPKVKSARLRPPAWLDGTARKEWRRIMRLARDAGIYTDLDAHALGMCCMAYSRAIQAYDGYREFAKTKNGGESPLITSKGGLNPFLVAAMKAEDQYRKWSAVLGLDPVARARMGLARKKAAEAIDPLEKLLNDVKDFVNDEQPDPSRQSL